NSPKLANYAGQEVIMGIRPSAFEDARMVGSEPEGRTVSAEVDVVEVLGYESFAHYHLPTRPVITPDIEELLADTGQDPSVLGDNTSMTARLSSDVPVSSGDLLRLVIDTTKLHFFDPETNDRIYG
ncbi:MAG: hypothetical protein HKO03_11570, partial [Acidimicrobiia bacterium]|nr:hypothetical protein [Acidimicrobiia bacterium]